MAALPVEVELRDPPTTPVYQCIAAEAVAIHERGVTVAAVGRYFGLDHHTVEKAIRWFRQR